MTGSSSSSVSGQDLAELFKEDLYGLLSVTIESTEKEIRTAYRKEALKVHPDKNPDNPNAAKQFNRLTAVFEVLFNKETRAEYDRLIRARQAAELRNNALDAKRRKLKDDLDRREREATMKKDGDTGQSKKNAAQKLADLLAELRANGSQLIKEEQEFFRSQMNNEAQGKEEIVKLRVKWRASDNDYDYSKLMDLFSKYGDVVALVTSAKKPSAIVEFSSNDSAYLAFDNEKGLITNPLSLEWMGKAPRRKAAAFKSRPLNDQEIPGGAFVDESQVTCGVDLGSQEDEVFEALRRAQERKRIIQEMEEAELNT